MPFALNARTDAFLRAGDRRRVDVLADATERGTAFLEAGATCVFVPGTFDAETVTALVDGIGLRKVSLIGLPGMPSGAEMEALGIARVSYGPWTLRMAMTALADAGGELLAGGALPPWARAVL